MKRLLDLPIDRPVATAMLLLCCTVLGIVAVFRLPLDFLPLEVEPEVEIEVPFLGSHPLETLREVALPIEEELATIPDVTRIETRASSGQVQIGVSFDWDVNIDVKRVEAREAVERARPRLPNGIGFIPVRGLIAGPADGAALQGRISAARDLSKSWELLDRRIKRPIERIKGVASVRLYGVEPLQVHVELDLDALDAHALRPRDVIETIDAANVDMDLGSIRGDIVAYDVRTTGRLKDLDDIRALRLRGGLHVRDVATVRTKEPEVDYGRHLDRQFAIGFDVYRDPTANAVETVDAVMTRIDDIERDPALAGISVLVWQNAGEQIRHSLGGLRDAGIYGGLLAALVLYFFLRNLRTTLIVAVAIPFSLIVTCGGMYALGAEFNVLTLLGLMLGVGMLVDNAVVVMENIHRLQESGVDPRQAARTGVRDMAMAVIASTATTVIVWSWLFVAEKSLLTLTIGQSALTVCLAVACSLLVSLTLIPLVVARVPSRRRERPSLLTAKIVPAYRTILAWTLRHRLATLILLLGLAASAVVPMGRLDITGEIEGQEYSVRINYQVHDPSTKEVLEGYVDRIEAWLDARQDELGYESMYSFYSVDLGVATRLFLSRERGSKQALAALHRRLEAELPPLAGVRLYLGESERSRRQRGGDGRVMVGVSLIGEEPELLHALAEEVERALREIPAAVDVLAPNRLSQQELRIRVDSDKAASLGVTAASVGETVDFAFRGRHLRRFQSGGGDLELVVGLPDRIQANGLRVLRQLPIPVSAPSNTRPAQAAQPTVPLAAVAQIETARVPPSIQRLDRETVATVNVLFDEGTITTSRATELIAEKMRAVQLPKDYRWSFGEWGRDRDQRLATMRRGVIASLVFVLLLMASLFESLTQPLAILVTLPFAFCGALWALWICGYELEMTAFIGVVILIGVVVNNGIVMVDHVNRLRLEHPRVDALLIGCGHRLRPILMTAITTVFGLVPLVLTRASVGGAYIDSLAVVVIGGLTTSTIFTLLALPVWYTTVEDVGSILRRMLPRLARGAFPWPRDAVLAPGERA
ncbi:MAG: efflux RND transporter permease subunit [Planctomycetota bacterium]